MSVAGHIYGVVLNDRDELERLAAQFGTPPYIAPPAAPVVYMKPRSAITCEIVPRCARPLVCAPTLALLMARDATCLQAGEAMACVGAAALAVDLSLPETSYYRPAVAQRNADNSLALGAWSAPRLPGRIETSLDGRRVHQWTLDRLARSPAELLASLSGFMTLRAGDVLLIGLPGDPPHVETGGTLRVEAGGLPALSVTIA